LLQRFRLEYHHEPLDLRQKLLTVPDQPVKINISKRVCLQWKAFHLLYKMRYILWVVALLGVCDVTKHGRHLGFFKKYKSDQPVKIKFFYHTCHDTSQVIITQFIAIYKKSYFTASILLANLFILYKILTALDAIQSEDSHFVIWFVHMMAGNSGLVTWSLLKGKRGINEDRKRP
ncbi:unnamed protein product, partial [Porites evermanni]